MPRQSLGPALIPLGSGVCESSRFGSIKGAARGLAITSVVIGLAVPTLLWSLNRHVPLSEIGTTALFSFVYSVCIGGTLWPVVPRVWVRSASLSFVLRWALRATVIAGGTVIGLLAGGLTGIALWGSHYGYWDSFWQSLRLALVISAVVSCFSSMADHFNDQLRVRETQLKTKELERERALKLATEARLSSLESRIHPHFLFNTMNSVSSLIHDDPARAELLLTKMAGLLRFSLDSAQNGLVPLEHEMHIVSDYLDIEKARFEARLRFSVSVPASMSAYPVPPLSVQTLVENSVKYAVSVSRTGALIAVKASLADGQLAIEVWDDGPGFLPSEMPAGHGLENLQDRLKYLFGDAAQLTITSRPGSTSVVMSVPVEPLAPVQQDADQLIRSA